MGRSASDESLGEGGGTRFGGPDDIAAQKAQDAEDAQAIAQAKELLLAGSVIDGKYRLDRILGEGGMGSVWQAHNLQLDMPVAIKLLRAGPDLAQLSERMKLEARSAARLVHPAIVRVFDIDTGPTGDPYIVMELLRGESLADVLDRGRLSTTHAVQIMLPIAEGLALAHAKGIVHRDLKPQIIFVAEEGVHLQPKLLDIGIAKLVDAALPAGSITDTGIMLGSPDYMSPEQARGQTDLDQRTDLWSFCVVLYEAITGITPFQGVNYNALMRAIIDEPPLPIPSEIVVEPRLQEILIRGLYKDRSLRPSSMQALGRELADFLLSRDVHEDVTGGALDQRWTGRSPQRSVPVITGGNPPPARPSPVPVPQGETLVSASAPVEHDRPSDVSIADAPPRQWPWLLAGVVLAALAGWALAQRGPAEVKPPASSSLATRAPAPPSLQPAAEAMVTDAAPSGSTSVQLAVTPPSPSLNPAPSSTAPVAKPAVRPGKAPAASQSATAKPGTRDGRDVERELLQAY
jgi:serine/threonine-protein kinase